MIYVYVILEVLDSINSEYYSRFGGHTYNAETIVDAIWLDILNLSGTHITRLRPIIVSYIHMGHMTCLLFGGYICGIRYAAVRMWNVSRNIEDRSD
jgi:hypothetical protein